MKRKSIEFFVLAALAQPALAATPADWTLWSATAGSAGAGVYNGAYGTITFNDWGYKGPTGVGVNDYQVGAGFNASNLGQVQHVVTTGPDWKTKDPASSSSVNYVEPDLYGVYPANGLYGNQPTPTTDVYSLPNASMDSTVNFYKWGYTTVAGSTFNNMQIDRDGNYYIAKNDMSFQFYDVFQYHDTTGANPDATYDSNINFQPYAVSDAKGWCGSVLTSNPNGLANMAGQVTFDFAFDAYMDDEGTPGVIGGGSNIQIVPGFVMRSYGDYVVDVTTGGGDVQHYEGSAVGNNTNPLTGALDPAYQNKVSFLGAGVVPTGVWVLNDGTPNVQVVAEGTPGATWHQNTFGGFAFLLRADGTRTLEWVSPVGHSAYVATSAAPLPAAVWLFVAGLGALAGVARRRRI